jgi:hypothetical protein
MNFIAKLSPSPWTRVMAAGAALVGVVATINPLALSILVAACAGILTAQGKIKPYAYFILRLWLPLAVGLCVVWGLVVRGSPQSGNNGGMIVGFQFAGMVSLRLLALAALFQAAVLSLEGLRLAAFLKGLGLSPNATAILVSVFNLWPDFARRADQVVAARCARGLMTDRRIGTRVRQFPWVLRTLFVGSLGSSLDRANRWEAEGLPQRLVQAVGRQQPPTTARWFGLMWCVVAVAWTTLALWRQ